MKSYNAKLIKVSIGASVIPGATQSVDNAGLGQLGNSTNTIMRAGFVSYASKKLMGGKK